MSKFAHVAFDAWEETKHPREGGKFASVNKQTVHLAKHSGGQVHLGLGAVHSTVEASGGTRQQYHHALVQKSGFQFDHTHNGEHATVHHFDHPEGHSATVREEKDTNWPTSMHAVYRAKEQKSKVNRNVSGKNWR